MILVTTFLSQNILLHYSLASTRLKSTAIVGSMLQPASNETPDPKCPKWLWGAIESMQNYLTNGMFGMYE